MDGQRDTSLAIEGYIKDNKNYNIIYAPNASYVGGISGCENYGICSSYAKGLEITGNEYVGGILGKIRTSLIYNDYCQDCTVTGNSIVGGIIGGIEEHIYNKNNSAQIYSTYNNAKVISKNDIAGGIIGYIDNKKTTNQGYIYRIYNNIVAGTEITASSNAGSIIGKVESPLYYLNEKTKYFYSNLVVSNLDENYPVGNIDNLEETYTVVDLETQEEHTQTRKVPPSETMSRLFYTIIYKYKNQAGKKVLEKEKLDKLKIQTTYTKNALIATSYFYYSEIATKFPMLRCAIEKNIEFLDGTQKSFTQTGILLPEEEVVPKLTLTRNMSLKRSVINDLPEYKVYTSDTNKINLEFNNKDSNAYFKLEYNTTISKEIPIEKRVYTFEYDFITPFKIIIGNSNGEKEEIITPDNISKSIGIIDSKYYSLKDYKLSNNLNSAIDGEFVNIFGETALTLEGYIYNIKNAVKGTTQTKGLKILENAKPLAEYVYNGNSIETYYNFSKVISSQNENITDFQMFIKNGKIYVLDGKLDIYADSVIIDSYNNKEYETVLGNDGIIYDLKEKLNYPENFKNNEILQMTGNINLDKNEILIMYKDGRLYAFNYITGVVLFDSKDTENNTIDKTNITSLYQPAEGDYEDATRLQNMLTTIPIEQAELNIATENSITNTTNNQTNEFLNNSDSKNYSSNTSNSSDNSYITVYDSSSNKYLVYKESTLINESTEKEEVISETEKISLNPELKKFYESANVSKKQNITNGIYFVIVSITLVCIILVIMYKKKNYE